MILIADDAAMFRELGALFLALWLTFLARPGRAQLDDPPPPDSAISA